MTAIGTVGAVVAALGIALWTERRSDKRIKGERAHSDKLLAAQLDREKTSVEDERAHARAQIEEERRLSLGRERQHVYSGFLISLDALERSIGTPLTADPEWRDKNLATAIGTAVGEVHRSYFPVYLTGSADILPVAETAWQAAWNLHDWTATDHPNATQSIVELEVLRERLKNASKAFMAAVRKSTAG